MNLLFFLLFFCVFSISTWFDQVEEYSRCLLIRNFFSIYFPNFCKPFWASLSDISFCFSKYFSIPRKMLEFVEVCLRKKNFKIKVIHSELRDQNDIQDIVFPSPSCSIEKNLEGLNPIILFENFSSFRTLRVSLNLMTTLFHLSSMTINLLESKRLLISSII